LHGLRACGETALNAPRNRTLGKMNYLELW
jgi:hypothetical protein